MKNQISCEKCFAPIQAENLNISLGIAKCDHCGHSFYPSGGQGNSKPKVSEVSGISSERTSEGYQLTRTWRSKKTFFLIFFTVFWNGFLVMWYSIAFSQENAPLMMKLFPIIHVAVGLGLLYSTLCSLFNKTVFTIKYNTFSVKHGPIPAFGNCEIPRNEVKQLWIKERIHRNKNSTSYSYLLNLQQRNGKDLKIGTFYDYERALKVEQEIESALGIQDKSVPGEHRSA